MKEAPTKIRPLTQADIENMGPFFLDLEQRRQEVAIGRYLCVGPLGEQWTTSGRSLERDREAISDPDVEGFRLYRMKNPKPLRCFEIGYAFALDTSNLHRWIRKLNLGTSPSCGDTTFVQQALRIAALFYHPPLWECQNPRGGYVTWNGLEGRRLMMRVIERTAFEQTYRRIF